MSKFVHTIRGIVPNYPDCNCEVALPTTADGEIGTIELTYCSKHAAALDMLAVLKEGKAYMRHLPGCNWATDFNQCDCYFQEFESDVKAVIELAGDSDETK